MNDIVRAALADARVHYETPQEVDRQRPTLTEAPKYSPPKRPWVLHESPELQDVLIACVRLAAVHFEQTGRLLPGLLFGRGTIIFEKEERKSW